MMIMEMMMATRQVCLYTAQDLLLFSFEFLSPSSSESLSTIGGIRTRIFFLSRCTTSCSFPRDFSISFPASLRDRFSVTVPLIWQRQRGLGDVQTLLTHESHKQSMQCFTVFKYFVHLKRNYAFPNVIYKHQLSQLQMLILHMVKGLIR